MKKLNDIIKLMQFYYDEAMTDNSREDVASMIMYSLAELEDIQADIDDNLKVDPDIIQVKIKDAEKIIKNNFDI